ncbi:MAG TPA: 3-hydroxyacyl-[acyl-carrier-protein] dehydratase FabZ [Alphaproteobacteria bacterium]|nr:3-hydroxyacyl-[acyl-carrier-protein] dehydratase FabZ [Alphaproteobacteria bacterium]
MQLNRDEIQKYIAHRDPMLLIDRVINCDLENEEIHAQFDVKDDWDILKGHFPGNPIMPGVLTVEASAQASAVLTNMLLGKTSEETLFYFAAIENVRFKHPVLPGNTIDLKVKITRRKASIVKSEAKVFVEGTLVTECAFTAKVLPRN